MNIERIEKISLSLQEVADLGYNILADSEITVIDRKTGEQPKMHLKNIEDASAMDTVVSNQDRRTHIDIFCHSADIIFDIKKEVEIENILISSYWSPKANYCLGDFALFAALNEKTLFNDENVIAKETDGADWVAGGGKNGRNHADWLYKTEGKIRFLGIRIYKANATDDVIRPKNIGVYSSKYTKSRTFVTETFGNNILEGLSPTRLTNNLCFDNDDLIYLDGKSTFEFAAETPAVDKVWVISKGEAEIQVCGKNAILEKTEEDRYVYSADVNIANGKLIVTAKGEALDQIVATTHKRTAEVYFNSVINNNFLGYGANVLPMSFMEESLAKGYNEAYWELEKRRILLVRPKIVRLWFQPDWLFETYEQYKLCHCNFDAPKMKSVYKWLDVLKEAGSEIEFNFGWKVSAHAQDWFSFAEVTKRNSAPKELDLFAKCCAATLKELINNRGYDNIKYLTFYNEPDYAGEATDYGDFCVFGTPRKEYWAKMAKMCYAELKKESLEYIELWGSEQSGNEQTQTEWMQYNNRHLSELLKMHTSHQYRVDEKSMQQYIGYLNKNAENIPVMITECGQSYSNDQYLWELNSIQHFIDLTNGGISGALLWCLNSMAVTNPCSFLMRDFIHMWDVPYVRGGIDNVRETFYETAILCRYIPDHSKSVESKVITTENMRLAAYKTDSGDYTILVELDASRFTKDLEIKLDTHINKKMYRHIYKRPCARNGNAILPPVSKEIFVEDTLIDNEITGDYVVALYTTITPVQQIELSKTEVYLELGEEYLLSATNIDGYGDIKWEMVENMGNGFIFNSADTTIKAKEDAKVGEMCALKAYNVSNPEAYAIMIVKVR